jgi:hypothetical protein
LFAEMGLEMAHTKCGNRIKTDIKTAHTFWKKSSPSLAITGINKTCAAHFTTILLALGFHTNSKAFDQYTISARCLLTLYYMSACIHKTVTCTAEITEVGILTSHQMSNQAHEAHRTYKEQYTCRSCFKPFCFNTPLPI